MISELDTVVLTYDIKKDGLKEGDVGTVVSVYDNARVAEVEFVTVTGRTVALVTLKASDIRSAKSNEVFHVRGYASG